MTALDQRSSCPAKQVLREFNGGLLADDDLEERLSAHLASCSSCESIVAGFDETDPIVALLRERDPLTELDFECDDWTGDARRGADGFSLDSTNDASKRGAARTDTWRLSDSGGDDDAAMPEKIGKYLLISKIGSGGFGTVFKARDPDNGRTVAIKMPRLHSAKRASEFLSEARTAAELQHPAIVQVRDYGKTDDGSCYVVMDYIEGKSLKEVLKTEKVTARRAAQILVRIADALHYAHTRANPVYHRDVKPANILLDRQGSAYLADFGLAMREDARWDHAHERAGTRVYMSPEQVRGEAQFIDGRTDIWALGVVLYELLTQKRPFGGESREMLDEEILRRPHRALGSHDAAIHSSLEQVCARCLKKKADERYPTAAQLAVDLRRYLRRPWWMAAAAASLLALIVFASTAVAMFGGKEDPPPYVPPIVPKEPPQSVPFSEIEWLPWSEIRLTDSTNLFQSPTEPNIDIDQQRKFVTLDAGPTALRLGNIESSQLPYMLRFRMIVKTSDLNYGEGGGVFIGYRFVETDPAEECDRYAYQEFSFKSVPKDPRSRVDVWVPMFSRLVKRPRIAPGRQTLIDETPLENVKLDEGARTPETDDALHKYEVELGVSTAGLELLKVNGEEMASFCTTEKNSMTSDRDYTGDYGIVHHGGKATYGDVQIRFARP